MDKVKSWCVKETLGTAVEKLFFGCKGEKGWPVRKISGIALRSLVGMLITGVLVFAPQAVWAQSSLQPTQISVGAPAHAATGDSLTVQALLVDSHGSPIPKETIYFTTQQDFLSGSGDMVLAQAETDRNGQAVAQFVDDFSGAITLRAEFRGDTTYAPSNGTASINATGSEQVYIDHIGVNIPGFNVPPVVSLPGNGPMASVQSQDIWASIDRLWPAMNGWPMAALLIIVWSMYFRAVTWMYRVAAPKIDGGNSTSE